MHEDFGAILALLHRIIDTQHLQLKYLERNMVNQQEFDKAFNALIAAEATRDAAVTKALNDLIAKVSSGQTIDLSAELAQVATLQANAAAITQTATASDPGATTVDTPPSASAAPSPQS